MTMQKRNFRILEINGGSVRWAEGLQLEIPPTGEGYADAQVDDYGLLLGARQKSRGRKAYPWRPGVRFSLRARFSHSVDAMRGTAGFGFWNAPFGDPTVRRPALPQACWFFFASAPSDLPLNPQGAGRGWFAATIDASSSKALVLVPLAPPVLLFNQVAALRRRIWPEVARRLKISFAPVACEMRQWHQYELSWLPDGCTFTIDGEISLRTRYSPKGPLGFVCWLDNQYLWLTNRGRIGWGVLPTAQTQWLEVDDLRLEKVPL